MFRGDIVVISSSIECSLLKIKFNDCWTYEAILSYDDATEHLTQIRGTQLCHSWWFKTKQFGVLIGCCYFLTFRILCVASCMHRVSMDVSHYITYTLLLLFSCRYICNICFNTKLCYSGGLRAKLSATLKGQAIGLDFPIGACVYEDGLIVCNCRGNSTVCHIRYTEEGRMLKKTVLKVSVHFVRFF